jgi:FMN phosphatase YigB (HAD superfamily)
MPACGVIIDGFSTLFSAPNLFCDPEVAERVQKYGYTVNPAIVKLGMRQYWEKAEVNAISDELRWRKILQRCGIAFPFEDAVKECILAEHSVVMRDCSPFPGMTSTLARLRTADVPIALCSNASRIHLQLEEYLGLRPIFGSRFFVSYEQGVSKADGTKLIEMAANSLAPNEYCVFVDDGLGHLERAADLGITTVWAVQGEVEARRDKALSETDYRPDFEIHSLPELLDRVLPELGITVP